MSKRSAELGRNDLPATRVKQVTDAVGNEHLQLVAGKGYWYFVYDDSAKGIFETASVMVMRLSDLTVGQWAAEGREFCEKTESRK